MFGEVALARPRRSNAGVYAALGVQTVISAGTFLAAKRALEELHPLVLVILRFAISGLLFAALLLVLPGRVFPPARAWPRIVLLGFLGGPVNQGLFFFGLARSVPAHGALLYALTPLGVYLYLLARGRERTSPRRFAGIAIAFTGVLVLLLGRGLAAASGPLRGDLFILFGVLAWVLYTAEGMDLIAEHGAFRATAWTLGVPAVLVLPVAPFVLEPARLLAASGVTLASVLYLGMLSSSVSYFLWYFALSRMDASRVAVFANLQPPATAVAAWIILGDPITWEILAGGALVIAGVRIAQRR
jgi:drug/metabolite transporter (DMT)-like permease